MNFFDLLQRASLFGLAALAVALLLQWVLANRVSAGQRVWIWRVALIQTALALVPLAPIALAILPARAPFTAPVTAPIIEAPPAAEPISPPVDAPITEAPLALEKAPSIEAMPSRAPEEAVPAPQAKSVAADFSWRALALGIYAFGITLQLLILARNARRIRRTLRACAPLDNALLRPIAARLNVRKLPQLRQSQSGAPFLAGIWRPMIVLPATLGEAHLEAVLTHELAHLRRRDLAWNMLLWALQTALWFHPLSWLSRRFHALEVESACDELTLQVTQIAPKSYGALLISAENSQASPLAAGVNDNFFALQTRLKRLDRAPIYPQKRVRWLLIVALLVSFAAVVPLRLTARAQNVDKSAAVKTRDLRGTVRDFNGQPIANATVYIMEPMDNGGEPRAHTRTDNSGTFALDKLDIGRYGVVVFVDAGARGVTEKQLNSKSAGDFKIELPQRSVATLVLRDAKQNKVRNVEVRLSRVGTSFNSWMAMPRAVKARYRATSDAAGLVRFPPLPREMLARFVLADQISKPTKFGLGDLRGGQYAPLAAEDAVLLAGEGAVKFITLVPPVRLEGRVTLGDGGAKGNVLILARRINAAESKGDDEKREQLIAQTRSNAQGRYVMDGLRPGRYDVWVYPEKSLMKDYAGAGYVRDLKAPVNRVDFQLSRGAIVQGVVISETTKKPVKGQTMWLFDSQENNQYTITDARGYFKFRALGGKQRLRVHSNGSNSPPPGFRLPAQSEFNFQIKNGGKRDFKIELPGASLSDVSPRKVKPIRGVIVGPDGAAAGGASVFYRNLRETNPTREVLADAQGRFVLPAKDSAKPVQIFADKGEATTPYSTFAASGKTVKLQLASGAWASIEGRATDEANRPLANAKIELTHFYGNNGITAEGDTTRTDAQGRYRYSRLRPSTAVWVQIEKVGYGSESPINFLQLEVGQTRRVDLKMRRAPATLAGIVYDTSGKPARDYGVAASGSDDVVGTDKNGRFAIPQVLAGQVLVTVFGPKQPGLNQWQPIKATGGEQNVVIRLANLPRNPSYPRMDRMQKNTIEPESLTGKTAPPLLVTRWANNRALALKQLRDKPVFLMFGMFGGNDNEMRDVARSFGESVHFVGVQLRVEGVSSPIFDISADEAARRLGIPVAVDAALPDKNALGWQTFQNYGQSEYAVIGRDGRVIYAGHKLERAIELATAK